MENNSKAFGEAKVETINTNIKNDSDNEFVQLFYEDKAGKKNLIRANAGLIVGLKYNGKVQDDGGKQAEVKIEWGATTSELVAMTTHLLHLLYKNNPKLLHYALNDFQNDIKNDTSNRMDNLKRGSD